MVNPRDITGNIEEEAVHCKLKFDVDLSALKAHDVLTWHVFFLVPFHSYIWSLCRTFNTTVDIRLKQWADVQLPKKCVEVRWLLVCSVFCLLLSDLPKKCVEVRWLLVCSVLFCFCLIHPRSVLRWGGFLYVVFVWPPHWPSDKVSASRAEDPGFESRLRWDFLGVESYQWLKNWRTSGYPARCLAL